MANECIHGFEVGLCDSCYPRQTAEQAKALATTARRAASGVPKRVAGAKGSSHAAPAATSVTLATQRIFHVTHISNLEQIVAEGMIRADATPAVDVSSALTRELRSATPLAGGAPVSAHVPFYLSPNASRWDELRSGAVGAHWSDAARAAKPAEFVVLATAADAIGVDVIVADGDATSHETRFAYGEPAAMPFLRRVRGDDPDFLEPEVLGPSVVAFDVIATIGVANERVRDQVKVILAGHVNDMNGAAPKVAVYPPWFVPTE
ncbi:hypothetical protein BH11ACT3_BH11ACT3_17950 [soil metagenome]